MSLLDEIDAETLKAGMDTAVALGHTPPVFDWLLTAFSYQGISDRVASCPHIHREAWNGILVPNGNKSPIMSLMPETLQLLDL